MLKPSWSISACIIVWGTLALGGPCFAADTADVVASMPNDGLHFFFKPQPTSTQQMKGWCSTVHGSYSDNTYRGSRPYGTCRVTADATAGSNPATARPLCETAGGAMVKGPNPTFGSGYVWACVVHAP
jgi:hypothetical protein